MLGPTDVRAPIGFIKHPLLSMRVNALLDAFITIVFADKKFEPALGPIAIEYWPMVLLPALNPIAIAPVEAFKNPARCPIEIVFDLAFELPAKVPKPILSPSGFILP